MRSSIIGMACAVAAAGPALAQSPNRTAAELSADMAYEEGDYGTGEEIRSVTLRSTLRLQHGRLILYGSVPYQRLDAAGNVVGGGGLLGLPIIVDPNQPATRDVREGLGDARIGAGVQLPRLVGIDLALSGEVKLPTAEANLGTGETDFSIGAEAARTFGRVTPFVALTYTMPGDPEGFELRDSLSARGGLAAQLSDSARGVLAYGYAQSVSPLVPDEQQISTAIEVGLSRRLSLGLEGSAGLSDGAADMGAGVRIGWRIF